MGEPQTPHFYDFGIPGRVPEPQNQYYLSLETLGYLKKSNRTQNIFWNIICIKLTILEIPNFEKMEKTGTDKFRRSVE